MTPPLRLALLVCLSLAPALRAAPPESATLPKKTYAVIVGISKNAERKIDPRPHAETDATALRDLLTSKKHLGTQSAEVKLLLGGASGDDKATRDNILSAIRWMVGEAGKDDLAVFAFFGQACQLGATDDRVGYFAVDSTIKDRTRTAVKGSALADLFATIRCERFCTFLDAGFGSYIEGAGDPPVGNLTYREFLGDDGSENHNPLPGRSILLADDGVRTAMDLKDSGVFAKALLDGLSGSADRESHDGEGPDGLVTVDELTRHVLKEVRRLSRLNGKTAREKTGAAYGWSGRRSNVVVCANPDEYPTARRRLEAFDELVKEKRIPARYSEEGHTMLSRMPRFKAGQELRKEYLTLVDRPTKLAAFEENRERILAAADIDKPRSELFAKQVLEATRVLRDEHVREVKQGEMVAWGLRALFAAAEETPPARIDAKLRKPEEIDDADLPQLLAEARRALGGREDLDKEVDVRLVVGGICRKLDSGTNYTDPETMRLRNTAEFSTFTGIGVQYNKDPLTDYMQIITPTKGSPAYKAGIQAEDLITEIIRETDGRGKALDKKETTSTLGLTTNEIRALLLGEAGTAVTLRVRRDDKPTFTVDLTRGSVSTESIAGVKRARGDDWEFFIDNEAKIAYVRLNVLATNTLRDLRAALTELKGKGMKAFILDLRFNQGGMLNTAINVADLFIDDGLIATLKKRNGKDVPYKGKTAGSLLDFPMTCLVNDTTASGAEMIAAAIQDHSRGLIFGERTYGTASVAELKDLDGELKGQLRITSASFYRPNGKSLGKADSAGGNADEWGVTPDKVIKLSAIERSALSKSLIAAEIIDRPDRRERPNRAEVKDRQLEAAVEYLRGAIKASGR